MKTKETFLTIDLPSGWKYGFPKAVSQEQYKEIKNLKQWCIDNGYPKTEADSYGDYFHIQVKGDLLFTLMNEKTSTREQISMEKQADLIESEFYKPNQKQYSQEEVDRLLDQQAARTTAQVLRSNQKQFKQFDESLFRAYISKFSDEDKIKAFEIIVQEISKNGDIKKIIATTDTSLRIGKLEVGGKIEHLPQIPQLFIEKFVEEYNKGNVITEVIVEYEEAEEYDRVYGHENKFPRLKINSDNTINIKPIISTSEEIGEKIVQYCKKYEGTNKYNDVLKAIEFGYQLSLNEDEK